MKDISHRSDCPISYALDFFGDKWSLLIIRDMLFEQKCFYKEFLDSKEKMATNILSDRLKKLEYHGLIASAVYAPRKTQKVYTLTEKGLDTIPVLVEIMLWSAKHDSSLAISDAFVAKVGQDRAAVFKGIRASANGLLGSS